MTPLQCLLEFIVTLPRPCNDELDACLSKHLSEPSFARPPTVLAQPRLEAALLSVTHVVLRPLPGRIGFDEV